MNTSGRPMAATASSERSEPLKLPRPVEGELRATIERLAPIDRLPTSPGEREAAEWIAARLRALGLDPVIDEEPAYASYAWPVAALSALGAVAGLLAGRGSRTARLLGAVGGAAATAGLIDEMSYGRQYARRAISPRTTTCNVVVHAGDLEAERTLVVMAHHDAAPSGFIFDHTAEEWFAHRYPHIIERINQNPPLWWLVAAGPALVAAGSALGSRVLRRTGIAAGLLTTLAAADIMRSGAVPGANDNLSAVAVLIALAEALRSRPISGLRVIMLCAGAEEALQEGIRGFAARHFPALDPSRKWFLNLDTVGSGNLVLLEAEGPMRMEAYHPEFKELVAHCAMEQGVGVKRGLKSRNSTDGVVPNRHGYPTATLVSVDDHKLLPHYHNHTDLPEHVDYGCVADAVVLTEAVARALAVRLQAPASSPS